MLTASALSDFRTLTLGSNIFGVVESQLAVLSAYRDRPKDNADEDRAGCRGCDAGNEVLCNLSAERLAPAAGAEPTIFVRDVLVCKSCLRKELATLRRRLHEIDFIELSSVRWQPTAIVITTEVELDVVLAAWQRYGLA